MLSNDKLWSCLANYVSYLSNGNLPRSCTFYLFLPLCSLPEKLVSCDRGSVKLSRALPATSPGVIAALRGGAFLGDCAERRCSIASDKQLSILKAEPLSHSSYYYVEIWAILVPCWPDSPLLWWTLIILSHSRYRFSLCDTDRFILILFIFK